jgi:hypothetical protein
MLYIVGHKTTTFARQGGLKGFRFRKAAHLHNPHGPMTPHRKKVKALLFHDEKGLQASHRRRESGQ